MTLVDGVHCVLVG